MKSSKRVSRHSLLDTIASAVAVEKQRIEQVDADQIDLVSGGVSTTPTDSKTDDTGTIGYIPPEPNETLS